MGREGPEVGDLLRDRIVAELHLGRVRAGDRLPSVREVAAELGVGVRAAVRAYHQLEAEGLVQIRSRSGVYVARQERLHGELLEETASWLAGVLVNALKRRIAVPGLPDFVRRCTAAVRPRCALLESTEDHLTILGRELSEEIGFEVDPVQLRSPDQPSLETADVLVTTTYHAATARGLADTLRKDLVVLTVDPNVGLALERRLRAGSLTVVCADPAFGARVQATYGARYPGAVRIVLADDPETILSLEPEEPVLLTLEARRRLGPTSLQPLLPHSPTISRESARELVEVLIRLNLAGQRES